MEAPIGNSRETETALHSGYGVRGDGIADDRAALQSAIDGSSEMLFIPEGNYKIGGTLRLPSGKWLKLHDRAVVSLADGAGTCEDVFLVANADPQGGNEAIRIEGGVWDGNNRTNKRGGDTRGNYTGVSMNFINVRGLELHHLHLSDAETYFIRTAEVRGFEITDVLFTTTNPRPNQDGIHVAGECHDGVIRDIRGEGPSATKDDLVALVADDALARAQNLGLRCGNISNVKIENLRADDCHSFVRLASVHHSIRDVNVRGVRGGCEACAVNMDALRYCAMPFFSPDDPAFANGAGFCQNILLSDFEVFRSKNHLNNPLLLLETLVDNFQIEGFVRLFERDAAPQIPTLRIAEIEARDVQLSGLLAEDALRVDTNGTNCFAHDTDGTSKVDVRGALRTKESLVFNGRRFDRLSINPPPRD